MNKDDLGLFGENLATQFLIKKGHEILDRNWRFSRNEIDIVSFFEQKLIVTEVKTRNTAEIGEPWRAVTRTKQKTIVQVAHQYVLAKDLDYEVQFDIISIVHNSFRTNIEHITEAFSP